MRAVESDVAGFDRLNVPDPVDRSVAPEAPDTHAVIAVRDVEDAVDGDETDREPARREKADELRAAAIEPADSHAVERRDDGEALARHEHGGRPVRFAARFARGGAPRGDRLGVAIDTLEREPFAGPELYPRASPGACRALDVEGDEILEIREEHSFPVRRRDIDDAFDAGRLERNGAIGSREVPASDIAGRGENDEDAAADDSLFRARRGARLVRIFRGASENRLRNFPDRASRRDAVYRHLVRMDDREEVPLRGEGNHGRGKLLHFDETKLDRIDGFERMQFSLRVGGEERALRESQFLGPDSGSCRKISQGASGPNILNTASPPPAVAT